VKEKKDQPKATAEAEAEAILSALHSLPCPISNNQDTTSPLRIRSLNKKKRIH